MGNDPFRCRPFGWVGPLQVDCICRLFFRGKLSPWGFSYEAAFAAWRNLKIKTTTEAGATRFNIVVRRV